MELFYYVYLMDDLGVDFILQTGARRQTLGHIAASTTDLEQQ